MKRQQRLPLLLATVLMLSSLFAFGGPLAIPTAQAAATITGSVFRDFNANGIDNGAGEIGVPGVTVTAYDAAGAVQGAAVTIANGTYSLSATGTGPYRIEFTTLPLADYTGPHGTGSGTTVQFVPDGNSSNINLGINYPADYSQADPRYATSRQVNGSPQDPSSTTRPAIYTARYLDQLATAPAYPGSILATTTQSTLGSVWGIAYERNSRTLYSSALVKRHAGLGTGGPGAIYAQTNFNPTGTNTAALFYNFPAAAVGTVASEAVRFPGTGTAFGTEGPCYLCDNIDPTTFPQATKTGIGSMDLSDDGSTLYVVTLADRNLHALNTQGTPVATPVAGAPWLSNAQCAGSGTARPWATTFYRDHVYVGVVCDASQALVDTTCTISGPCAALTAQVYIYDVNTPSWSTAFATPIPLTYAHQEYTPATTQNWHPWVDDWNQIAAVVSPVPAFQDIDYGQPVLSNIKFDVDGSMLLAFFSRTAFQTGYYTPGPHRTPNAGQAGFLDEAFFSGGDILRAGRATASGPYTLENAGQVPSPAGMLTGANTTTFGPGGGEFYNDVWFSTSETEDTGAGAIMVLPGSSQVAQMEADPYCFSGMGVRFFNNLSGASLPGLRQFYQSSDGCQAALTEAGVRSAGMGKVNGMGGAELLLDPAPIEVGNRVWGDADGDGVQDAGESGLDSVAMQLWADTNADSTIDTQIGTTTTASGGQYYFGGVGNTNLISGQSLKPNTAYEVRVSASQPAVIGSPLSPANADASPNGDARDSDATLGGSNAVVAFTTGGAGANNHSYDIGFVAVAPQRACVAASTDLGGVIFQDFNGNGLRAATEPGYNRSLGPITVTAYDMDNHVVLSTTATITGTYNFPNIFATHTAIRLEFSGIPAPFEPSAHGTTAGSATTVQRHVAGGCAANLAINVPVYYCQANPDICTDTYINGGIGTTGSPTNPNAFPL